MLLRYFHRCLQIRPPSLIFIILSLLIIRQCSMSSEQILSVDKYVCAKADAASLPTGVTITRRNQIRYSNKLTADKDFQLLLTHTDTNDLLLKYMVVSHGECNFNTATCEAKDKHRDHQSYLATGKCLNYFDDLNCKIREVICQNDRMYHVKELSGARIVTFQKLEVAGTTCDEWEAFVDNARFLLTNLNEELAESCVPQKDPTVWPYVMIGVGCLIVAIIAVTVTVVMLLRRAQRRRQGGQSTIVQQQNQSIWQRAKRTVWKQPMFIFLRGGRRGSRTKVDDETNRDEPTNAKASSPSKHRVDPSSKYRFDPSSKYRVDPSSKFGATSSTNNNAKPSSKGGSTTKESSITEPSSKKRKDPSSKYRDDPSSKYRDDPSSKYRVDPSSKYRVDPSSKYRVDPSSKYRIDPSSKYDSASSSQRAVAPKSKGGGSSAKPVVDRSGGEGGSAAKAQPPSTNNVAAPANLYGGSAGAGSKPKSFVRSAYF